MLPEPTLGYKLFVTGLLFVVGALLALTSGVTLTIPLITGNMPQYSVGEGMMTVMGLAIMGISSFIRREVRNGRM